MMTEDRYLLAAFLPEEELRRIEREAEGDPSALAMIRASRDLKSCIGEATAFTSDAGSESALAFLAAARLVRGSGEDGWAELLDRMERRVEAHPEARSAYERMTARILELESESDAEAHFRRVTGSAPPRIHRIRPLLVAASVVAVIVGAGTLGSALEDPLALAAHRSLGRGSTSTFRGPAPGDGSLHARALHARRRVLGLWPVYDRAVLEEVAREVARPDSAAGWLLAGQVRLMLGDREGALDALRRARTGSAAREAAALLQEAGEVP